MEDIDVNAGFEKYLEEAIGRENAAVAFSALNEPPSVSVRMNPFKVSSVFGDGCGRVPWSPHGIFLDGRPSFTLDPLFHGGAYYVQDSSAMFVGEVFRMAAERMSGNGTSALLRVLDLCAAPGGKTTDMAASLREMYGDRFVLVANEVMKQRAGTLASNVAVWGDPCVVVSSDDPSSFAAMKGAFDIIVADVPCSGEGMFRKDEDAVAQWSENNVRLCQGRQRRIVADVWDALAEGGVLVYSTCTFNRYENDDNVHWIAETLGAECLFSSEDADVRPWPGVLKTEYGFCLVPGLVRGEGQYCSALRKTGGHSGRIPAPRAGNNVSTPAPKAMKPAVDSVCTEGVRAFSRGGILKALPESAADDILLMERNLHVLASGCAVGEIINGTLVPDPDLALSLVFNKDAFPSADLGPDTALAYLRGDCIVLEGAQKGYVSVRYKDLPIGFVKNLGTRCNNLYPRSRRIRKMF